MLILNRDDLERVLDFDEVIAAVDRAFVANTRGAVVMPPRHILSIPGGGASTYVMPAFVGGIDALGVKVLSDFPHREGGRRSSGVVLLFDGETGEPLALMDALLLTAVRTGATSAVAARYLTPRDYKLLGILGAGTQALYQVLALARVRPLSSIKIWNRTPARAREMGETLAKLLGCQVGVVDEPRQAIVGSQLVITATRSTEPILRGEWLEPGMHIASIGGGNTREADDLVFKRSTIVVDSVASALSEARDLREALKEGSITREQVSLELGEVISGKRAGRTSVEEITLFRSLGLALEDVAAARAAFEAALAEGIGQEVDLVGPGAQGSKAGDVAPSKEPLP